MKRNINRVKLFANQNDLSMKIESELKKLLLKNEFEVCEEDYDLAIAIGGDGSFLRMVHQNKFNSKICYIGVNTGTLGFAQEFSCDHLTDFIDLLMENKYYAEAIGYLKVSVKSKNEELSFQALNEVVFRDQELNTAHFSVFVNDDLLEHFSGDGLLISTSFGSTAYNLSFGGSIVSSYFSTLQITPIAPLNNRSYRNLLNSVIFPDDVIIKLVPKKETKNLLVGVDGENFFLDEVEEINIHISSKKICTLRDHNSSYTKKIHQKFLT